MTLSLERLLWLDSRGGLLVGVVVLALAKWLTGFFALPLALVVTMGVANLAYGSFSFALSRQRPPSRGLVTVLVLANAAWAVFCAITVVVMAAQASVFGIAHIALEGAYVGALAVLEWRYRPR